MSFTHPERLALGILLCVGFILAYRIAEGRRRSRALTYSNLPFALEALGTSRWPAILLASALTIGVLALAIAVGGPRIVARLPVKDATVVLCLDTSGSMAATDVQPSRIVAAKAAARAFVDDVPEGTRIGVVTFAGDARTVLPPTDDRDAVRAALERVPAPNGATALGDAIALAAEELPLHGRRAIVVLTDGISNRGSGPLEAARAAGRTGVTVDAVGIGTSGSGLLIPGTTEPDELDEITLRALSVATAGTYVRVADARQLRDAFRALAAATVWESRTVNGSLPFALAGGGLLAITLLAGLAAGRWP